MKILICSAESPVPPPTGSRILLERLIANLGDDHDVRVIAFRMPDQGDVPDPRVTTVDWPRPGPVRDGLALARALATRRPLRPDRNAGILGRLAAAEIERFQPDVVHVFSPRMAPIISHLGDRPAVISALDAWHLNAEENAKVANGLRRWLLHGEYKRVLRYDRRAYSPFDKVVVNTDEDAQALRSLDPSLDLDVIPVGVDAEWFTPDHAQIDPGLMMMHGVMHYSPNMTAIAWFVDEVLPRVLEKRPDARLALVGRDPAPEIAALAERPQIEVTGGVEHVPPWLCRAQVYVAGMQGGTGIKGKILEAMACARPVVTTTLGTQGIRVTSGHEVFVADDPAGFAEATLALLNDQELAARMGARARDVVQRDHSWKAVADAHQRAYQAAMDQRAV